MSAEKALAGPGNNTCHVIVCVQGMAFLHSLDRQLPRLYLNSKHIMVSLFPLSK
jgi:hypothetical protein